MSKNKFEITIGGWVCQVLGIVFVTLKLTHYIEWSWWWVTAPFWGPFAITMGFLLLVVVLGGILSMFIKH